MPWNNGGPGPWGPPGGAPGGPGKPGGQRPGGPWGGRGGPGPLPDIDELIARVQAFVRGLLPGGGRQSAGGGPGGVFRLHGRRGTALLGLIVFALWLASGFYRVQPDEEGVVLRFGAFVRQAPPGLNYHLPWPVERVELPAVTRINRMEIGYRSAGADQRTAAGREVAARQVPEESLMLTGDENIIDINFAVFWHISNAPAFLFNTRNPEVSVKSVAESVMREVIGRTPIQPALTDARAQIEQAVQTGTQTILDQYRAGVEITQVQLQRVDPPSAVIDSFRDVQRANTEAERAVNEAEAYRNNVVPRARGDAARITAEADGARQASIAEATGQGQRFLSVLAAYQSAKDVTLRRLYIETMQQILMHTPAVVVDDRVKGLLPLLPLNGLGASAAPAPPTAPPASSAAPPAGVPQASLQAAPQ
ncbi:MAG: FtsH protease activity modulator HflK [Acidisphaera sp.]|nr:FtsH protease activity modulator HflK [Acidisphaera sp.]